MTIPTIVGVLIPPATGVGAVGGEGVEVGVDDGVLVAVVKPKSEIAAAVTDA